jgi:hypothetical protein
MNKTKLISNIFSLLICLLSLEINAQTTVSIGDLKYLLDSPNEGEATVSGPNFTLESYTSASKKYDLVIPATITNDGTTYNVTEIADSAFYAGGSSYDRKNVRSLKFETPSNVKVIGDCAFFDTWLGGESGKDTLYIPESVEEIGEAAFLHDHIPNVEFQGSGLKKLGRGAFYWCMLNHLQLPPSLEEIDGWCFSWDPMADWYTLVDGEKKAKTLPPNLKTLGNFALAASNFDEITIPDGIQKLGECVFWGADGLEAVYVDNDKNQLLKVGTGNDEGVLFSKDGKTLVHFPAKNKYFADKTKRFQYKVPSDVETIGSGAFSLSTGYNVISSVVLPTHLKAIGALAFYGMYPSPFTHLTIPAEVTSMGRGCMPPGCEEVEFLGAYNEDMFNTAFSSFSESQGPNTVSGLGEGAGDVKLYVKKSLYDTYSSIKDGKTYTAYNSIASVSYKIPIQPSKKLTTLCRDFDIQLVDAAEEDMGSGTNPLTMYIATEEKSDGMTGDGVTGEEGKYYQDYMVMSPVTYVPSRTGDNNDDYTGVVVRVDDTSNTYYYEIGENDCYSDNQTTLSQTNYLLGAPCYVYVRMNEAEDGSAGSAYKTLGLNNGIFKWYSKDGLISEEKAFLRIPASSEAKTFTMKFENDDTVNGITDVNSNNVNSEAWYSLQGVRLNGKPTSPGVYIHGNRKVLVK